MTIKEMVELRDEYGPDMVIEDAVHLHDEDSWNKFTISYKGIIVGSELVSKEDVRKYIAEHCQKPNPTSEYLRLMMNIENAAMCVSNWAALGQDNVHFHPGCVHRDHVDFANEVYRKRLYIAGIIGVEVKGV